MRLIDRSLAYDLILSGPCLISIGTHATTTTIWTHPDYGVATASMRELAEVCRQHKELMFRAPDHRYDRAVPGSYRLVPTEDMQTKLETDCRVSDLVEAGIAKRQAASTCLKAFKRTMCCRR